MIYIILCKNNRLILGNEENTRWAVSMRCDEQIVERICFLVMPSAYLYISQ